MAGAAAAGAAACAAACGPVSASRAGFWPFLLRLAILAALAINVAHDLPRRVTSQLAACESLAAVQHVRCIKYSQDKPDAPPAAQGVEAPLAPPQPRVVLVVAVARASATVGRVGVGQQRPAGPPTPPSARRGSSSAAISQTTRSPSRHPKKDPPSSVIQRGRAPARPSPPHERVYPIKRLRLDSKAEPRPPRRAEARVRHPTPATSGTIPRTSLPK